MLKFPVPQDLTNKAVLSVAQRGRYKWSVNIHVSFRLLSYTFVSKKRGAVLLTNANFWLLLLLVYQTSG